MAKKPSKASTAASKGKTPADSLKEDHREEAKRTLAAGFARQLAHDLDVMRSAYREGKKIRLLEAAVRCGKMKVPLPSWVVDGLEEVFRRYSTCEVRTLDEAFGVSRPKGFHSGKMNEVLTKSLWVSFRVEELRRNGQSVSDEFFDGVGREFAVSSG